MKTQVFWDTTVCRLVNNYRRYGGMFCLNLQGICNSLTLQMEATLSYEKSLTIFQATGHRNLEAFNLHQHHCEDLGLHKPGNVEKTKGINKGKSERDIGGKAKSTMSIIQYRHTTYTIAL
jgi:hypothetical protein